MKKNNRLEVIVISIVALLMIFAMCSIKNTNISFLIFCVIPLICFSVHFLFKHLLNKEKESSNRWQKIVLVAIIFVLLIFLYIIYSKVEIYDLYGKVTVALSVYLSYGLFAFAYGSLIKKWKIENLFLILGSSIGLFMMINLPLRGVPDEVAHILTAYKISDVILGKLDQNEGTMMIRHTDEDMFYEDVEYECDREMMNRYYMHALDVPDLTETETEQISLQGSDLAYVLPGITISLGRILHFNGFWTLLSGRIINLLLYLLLIYFGIKIMPFGKDIAFSIALLPMSMQQGMSYSYDSILIGTSIYTVCATINWYYSYENRNKFYYVGMVISASILILIKSHAYFMVGLFPLYMVLQKKKDLKKFWKIVRYVVITFVVLFGVYTILDLIGITPDILAEPTNLISWADYKQGYTLAYLINNPAKLVFVYINTILMKGIVYIVTMVGMALGWLNIRLSKITVLIYIASLAVAFVNKDQNQVRIDSSIKKYMVTTILITAVGIFCALLIGWTPLEYKIIQGIQGRYFIELLPLVGCLFYGLPIKFNIKEDYLYVLEWVGAIALFLQLLIRFS